jgi:FMN phosphatase YigB (HAD superfamily)
MKVGNTSRVATVLFDIGGVLVSDVWETILLTPERGIADQLRLDRGCVRRAGEQLWQKYAVIKGSEAEYWVELGRLLNTEIPVRLRGDSYALLEVHPAATQTLRALNGAHVQIGVITNNTTFWFERQLDLLPTLREVSDRSRWFVSCDVGTTKRERPGLFGVAARHVDPNNTLVIDDRPTSIEAAREFGFIACRRALEEEGDLIPGDLIS